MGTVLIGNSYLDLNKTARSGQCFRWQLVDGSTWKVPVAGHIGLIERVNDNEITISTDIPDESFWRTYLGLDYDYDHIFEHLWMTAGRTGNSNLLSAYDCGYGISILHQPFFETCISFLISQNNNIPRIKKIISSICGGDGEPFPKAEELARLLLTDDFGLGYRHRYLLSFCQSYLSGKFENLESTAPLDMAMAIEKSKYYSETKKDTGKKNTDEREVGEKRQQIIPVSNVRPALSTVLEQLQTAHGIGPKVASCIALFSLGYLGCVPRDVWIKRAEEQYDVHWDSQYAGYQQQLIFFWQQQENRRGK